MAFPTIVFNSSTGSDSAASGAGPSTAVTGTCAASTTTTTVTFQGAPDLSGVATDGSAALWVDGIGFSSISAVDNGAKTVVVDTALTIGAGTAFSIGGKRATFNATESRRLFAATSSPTATGAKGGWTIQTETDQTITTVVTFSAAGSQTAGLIRVIGTGGTRPVINQTGVNAAHFTHLSASTGYVCYEYLKLTNSNATKNAAAIGCCSNSFIFRDVVFGDAANKLFGSISRVAGQPAVNVIDCDIRDCTSNGLATTSMSGSVIGCRIYNNGAAGIVHATQFSFVILSNLIYGNVGDGISVTNGTGFLVRAIIGNVIHGNGGDGLDTSTSAGSSDSLNLQNNCITGNTGYGWRAFGSYGSFWDFNNYGTGATANTAGAVTGLTLGDNDLQVDPGYINAVSGNFATTGSSVKDQGFPDSARTIGANQSSTTAYVDIGIQQQGGGVLVARGMHGGMRS